MKPAPMFSRAVDSRLNPVMRSTTRTTRLVLRGQPLQPVGPLYRTRQRRAVEILGVLDRHVPGAQSGRQPDHVVPVAILHRHHEDGHEDAEDDRRERDVRAAAVPPQVAPRHLRETAALHRIYPLLHLTDAAWPPRD